MIDTICRPLALMKVFRLLFFSAIIIASLPLEAALMLGPHRLSLFAEGGRLHRKRSGGTHQKGTLLGYGCEYERLKKSGFYLFGRAAFDEGTLRGSTGSGFKIKSRYDSQECFGRAGWAFCFCEDWTVAPFLGGGYYRSENRFVDPSPIPVKMRIHFPYAMGGAAVEWRRSEEWVYTFSLQGKKPFDPECVIEDDPDFFDIHQMIKSALQWDAEAGFRKKYPMQCGFEGALEGQFFYRLSRYGKKENYPFDFTETKQRFIGFRVSLTLLF